MIFTDINSILKSKSSLTLIFISDDYANNPGLILLKEINDLGSFSKKEKDGKEIYKYSNGLTLESYNFDSIKSFDSDGVFIIFDAKSQNSIDPQWNTIILNLIEKFKDNMVILIGVKTKEKVNWQKMIGEFDFYTKLEERQISYFIFNLSSEFRLELYEQLNTLFNTIKNL